MVATVKTRELAELRRAELLHLPACGLERLEVFVRHFQTPEAVEQNSHLHAFALLRSSAARSWSLIVPSDQMYTMKLIVCLAWLMLSSSAGTNSSPLFSTVTVPPASTGAPTIAPSAVGSGESTAAAPSPCRRATACAHSKEQSAHHRDKRDHADDEQGELPPFISPADGCHLAPIP